jgi:putative DNA methylase
LTATAGEDGAVGAPRRKLIEVALPLETINRESAREKSIRHGHPSTLHLWWARRPLAAARAVLFAQLVDDPSSHPDRFPSEDAQRAERERLHRIIERLVVWENTRDQALLAEAHEEILKSTGGNPPPILDPFAGGGTIPLEAQRLGLEAHASDLNPVAVLINKALIEIPPKFAGRPPVFPGLADSRIGDWDGATGLAADVRAYGEWMRDEAQKRIGHHYPKATLDDGTKATVIAWIWARTVTCPNPACGIEMPLVRSWWLGKKKGKEKWVQPIIAADPEHPSGKRVDFEIGHGVVGAPSAGEDGTMRRSGATCVACGSTADLKYVRSTAQSHGLGATLMAVVAEGHRRREYLAPVAPHLEAAIADVPDDVPTDLIPTPNHDVDRLPMYGMPRWCDAFTGRQLVALATFSDLVVEARERALRDALKAGAPSGDRLESGGVDAEAYADAVTTYLGAALSRTLNKSTSICSWDSSPKMEAVRGLFARQTISMAWDFAEANVFGSSSGNYSEDLEWVTRVLERLPVGIEDRAQAIQADAASTTTAGALIATDPPYYDNIGYSDLSDFFYVWLRRSLRSVHPELLSTLLVPKAEELVANPYRHNGMNGARHFFEDGFRRVFVRARETALAAYPITVFYAFKQSDAGDDGTASTGWETLLDGMIRSGWAITATWPMRSELSNRMLSRGTNALASSIVLALRPRPEDAPTTDRRGLIAALHNELPDALRKLQQGTIAPVDLPQAAIGPGMAVFSRYAKVIENDGSTMTVRSALARINEILDQVLNEQEGDFDAATRFAIAWYRGHGYTTGRFGVADDLARARNTAVETLVRDGILTSAAGKVTLLSPAKLPTGYDVLADERVGAWEVLHHLIAFLQRDGLPVAGAFLASAQERTDGAIDGELVKELAFLAFSIAEENGWTQDALAFNTVATAWPDIVQAARSTQTGSGDQAAFTFEED